MRKVKLRGWSQILKTEAARIFEFEQEESEGLRREDESFLLDEKSYITEPDAQLAPKLIFNERALARVS